MPDQTLTFIFQLTDKINKPLMDVLKNFEGTVAVAEKAGKATENFSDKMTKLGGKMFLWNQASQAIQSLNGELQKITKPGQDFQTSMADLSAITGVVGDKLDEIGGKARSTAKIFGLDAAQSAESYKLILSQLAPEIVKSPEALDKMGRSIAILSKTMGGNTAAAAEVLTTAMNQYQVSLANPIAASEEMARMMNVMSAAAKEGSAELPQIKSALEQAGMQAKMSGVSFEELNAAIQVLDKAGKKGAEGGVAIRNVMTILSEGRFMDKSVSKNLEHIGISVKALGDVSKPLADRLKLLKPVMGDAALMAKMFGRENEAAAMALISGTSAMDDYKNKITGTNEASNQAAIVMDTYGEKMKRLNSWFGDLGISIFNTTQGILPFITVASGAVMMLANLGPAITMVGTAYTLLAEKIAISTIAQNIFSATFWTTTFSSIIPSCEAIGLAIMSIPIIGWIAAGITLITGAFIFLWNKFDGFRAGVMGVLEVLKEVGTLIWHIASGQVWKIPADISNIGSAYERGYNKRVSSEKVDKSYEETEKKAQSLGLTVDQYVKSRKEANAAHMTVEDYVKKQQPNLKPDPIVKGLGAPGTAAEGSGKNQVRNNNIRIESLVKQLIINAKTLPEATSKIKEEIVKVFIDIVRDTEIAIS